MNKKTVCFAVVFVFFNSLTYAQVMTPAEREIISELHKLRQMVGAMQSEITKLKEAIEKKKIDKEDDEEALLSVAHPRSNFTENKGDIKKLRALKLPKDATKEEVEKYLHSIAEASQGQNSFSTEDYQVFLITQLGTSNVKYLIEFIKFNPHLLRLHFGYAITQMVRTEHKELILENLKALPVLSEVILRNGWAEDAKDILLDVLKNGYADLPSKWIEAVASLNDPATYDSLKKYFIKHNNRGSTFKSIQHLPGIELDEAVAEAWKMRGMHEWERRSMAKIALEYGHVDALEMLLQYINLKTTNSWEVQDISKKLFMYVDQSGSSKEIYEWVKTNREKIIFDKKEKKYKLGS
jgi:hypothetical protein